MNRFLLTILCILCLLGPDPVDLDAAPAVYVVRKGDTLYSIARNLGLTVSELKRLNALKSNNIQPGMSLRTGKGVTEIVSPNGPYYGHAPKLESQTSRSYSEPSRLSLREDYERASALLAGYRASLAQKQAKTTRRPLAGWRIVLDPGHGGLDPGAIVPNLDGKDRNVYVVEDEYVYDVVMRMMARLIAAGAEVELTLISPNHTLRDNLPARYTFVHEQNEVYNDAALNRTNRKTSRPMLSNIGQRVRIANRFFKGGQKGRRLFVSIHADNSPGRPKGPLVIYHERRGRVDRASRNLAGKIRDAMDRPSLKSQIGGRGNLAVLRNNNADAEVLVEIRNVSIKDDAYALRFGDRREEDAALVVKGIVDYAVRR